MPIFEETRRRKFLAKTKQDGQCLRWLGAKTRDGGHGQAAYRGTVTTAHRVAYLLFVGPIPAGRVVCHECDNPWCVNINHLWLGTQKENLADMRVKGRANDPRGERHLSAKLTETQVFAIRADPRRHADIAREYGIAPCSVTNIKARRKWRHL